MAKDCEQPDKCRKCGEEGHMSKNASFTASLESFEHDDKKDIFDVELDVCPYNAVDAVLKHEMQAEEPKTQSQIDTMIIFDRQVDLISPLITQLTYEGLIDEFFGNKNSSVKSSSEKYAKNQDDDLFKSGIKCGIHFGGIAPYLEQDYDPQDELMVCD